MSHLTLSVRQTVLSLCLGAAALALAPAAMAQTVNSYDKVAHVGNTELQLNGSGTRFKAIFKVYDMGLYVSRTGSSPKDVYEAPGAKRLSFVALRDINAADIGLMLIRGLEANSDGGVLKRYHKEMAALTEVFSSELNIKSGQAFRVDFVPGKGVVCFMGNKQAGQAFGNEEFFNTMLRVWLGDKPADERLKRALLGLPPVNQSTTVAQAY